MFENVNFIENINMNWVLFTAIFVVTEKEMESNRKTLKQLDREIAVLTEKRKSIQNKQDVVYERNRKLTQDADELDKKLRCCENILKVVPNT